MTATSVTPGDPVGPASSVPPGPVAVRSHAVGGVVPPRASLVSESCVAQVTVFVTATEVSAAVSVSG